MGLREHRVAGYGGVVMYREVVETRIGYLPGQPHLISHRILGGMVRSWGSRKDSLVICFERFYHCRGFEEEHLEGD